MWFAVVAAAVLGLVGARWLLRRIADGICADERPDLLRMSEDLELLTAKKTAAALLDEAKKKAAALLDEAEQQAHDIIRCAKDKAESIVQQARAEAQKLAMVGEDASGSWNQPQVDLVTCLLDESGSDWLLAASLAQLSRTWSTAVAEWRGSLTRYVWRDNLIPKRTAGITEEELLFVGRSCPQLTQLDISRCFSISDAALLAAIEGCPRLLDLNVSCCESKLTDDVLFKLAEHCSQLTALNLSYCAFGEAALEAVAAGCRGLRSLLLNACSKRRTESVTDGFVTALARGCPQLTELDVSQCRALTDRALLALSESCPQLQTLKLSGNGPCTPTGGGIYDAGVIAIARPSITKLDLGSCKITDAALLAIAQNCPSLTSLNIGGLRLEEEEKLSARC